MRSDGHVVDLELRVIFRDYLYLDTKRLRDYWSSLDLGMIEESTRTTRSQKGKDGGAKLRAHFLEAGGGVRYEDEVTESSRLRSSELNTFSSLYELLVDSEKLTSYGIEDPLPFEQISKSQFLEITRDFYRSPLRQLVDSIGGFQNMMSMFGMEPDPNQQEAIRGVTALLSGASLGPLDGSRSANDTPMYSRPDGSAVSVVFQTVSKYILADDNEFHGELSVCGRVRQMVPKGQTVNLYDFIGMPAVLRKQADLEEDLTEKLASLSGLLGSPVSKDTFIIPGPAIVVAPLAVYEA